MALSAENKRLIARQMKSLDYVEGSGLFPREKRQVNNNRYLIISYGGTGSDALYQVKKLLQDELPEDDYKTHVRVLAIDTDADTRYEKATQIDASGQETTIRVDKFTTGEFLWLDNKPARNAIVMGTYDNMKDWLNPSLPETIKATPNMLDGTGAGATRQLGRILLSPAETFGNFQAKIKQVAGELVYGNADNLRIFIISGIAGGTGSGIVIDATYMIRHAIKEMGALANRTTYTGFILLPPTGKEKDATLVERGNRNGVAALKEIEHFMTIANRKEQYVHRFGNIQVADDSNIFDTCYLLDGSTSNVINENPREKAVEVLKDCVLDLITSQPVVNQGATTVADVASYMCDAPAFQQALVANESETVAPREANYIYCAIGHGQMLIPMELMKAYVAKKVFDKMYAIFQNFRNVTEEDVEEFLDNVECPGVGAFSGASGNSPQEIRAAVNKEINERFRVDPNNRNKKGGPYYVINLLAEVMTELRERNTTVSQLAIGRQREERCNEFKMIYKIVEENNNKYFEVYVAVFEELKKYLEKSSNILCDSELFRGYYKSSYTFTPIDFGSLDEASKIVKDYLDGLINGVKVGSLCGDIIQEIISNRDEWSELVVTNANNTQPRFAAPQRIREFWQQQINKIVNATLEDYLIKYYSGDPKAEWEVDANGVPTPAADAALKTAATALVKQMWGPAGAAIPLAELHSNIMPADRFNGKKSFLIPKGAPHLIQYVKAELAAQVDVAMQAIQVAPSTANDRISCYAQFTCIPAYMFRWVTRAEPNYEQYIQAATNGLHMSETTGGALWRNFPNLIPEVMWPHMKVGYSEPREAELNKASREIFAEAKALGLTTLKALEASNEVGYYTIRYLPKQYMVDGMFLKAVDSEMQDTPAKKTAQAALDAEVTRLADTLFAMKQWANEDTVEKEGSGQVAADLVKLDEYKLQFVHTVMTPLTNPKPTDWEDNLAAALLRTTPENSYRLRGTVMVLDRLYNMICQEQAITGNRKKFGRYLVAGLFQYVEADSTWYYLDAAGAQTPLLEITYGDTAMETAVHYFLFEEFSKNANAIIAALDMKYQLLLNAPTPAERKQKTMEMYAKKEPVLAKIKELMTFDMTNPGRPCIMSESFAKAAKARKYDVAAIRSFYGELKDDLEYFVP